MITFEEARAAVAADVPDGWVVADWGSESDELYQIPTGPPEAFEAYTETFEGPMDLPLVFVDKESGAITRQPMISSIKLLDSMTPIGNVPA